MTETEDAHARRSSIDKQPVDYSDLNPELGLELELELESEPSAFQRLPDEIIQQIARLSDPGSFASLALLNSKWRSASQDADLYAYQLSQCPSYSASHRATRTKPVTEHDLPGLRSLFAHEVKRNLFEAYLRPRKTVINLVSNSISSSSCPGGEGLQFNPSPRGHHLLAYNSSRIYVIDARGPEIAVKRELKILRRPVATCITDNGCRLAVLLTEMQVDIYDLGASPPKRTQSIILDHSPRAIALSPCGGVLAAAYEGGIEVSSLKSSALPTDRRAVKCDAVDALTFSFDGTQILGTNLHSPQPTTVIITAPYYDPGSVVDEDPSALWTTSILFPNSSRDCSHAALIQNSTREEASWAFTYDRSFETFRAVRIEDLRNGTTYFTGPIPDPSSQATLLPCTLPTASYHGELVSAGFQGKEIWLYGVPEELDPTPEPTMLSVEGTASGGDLSRQNSSGPKRSPSRGQEPNSDVRMPQWQLLCDKTRNTFVAGVKIAQLNGVNTVKWVEGFGQSSIKERLVVAARGVLPPKLITEEDGIDFVDGGRITLIDFDYAVSDGQATELTIEVGTKEPEVLEEETRDMAAEVAIVRRRTVAQRRGNRGAVSRAATTASRAPPVPEMPPLPTSLPSTADADDDPLLPRRIGAPPTALPRATVETENNEPETESIIEEQEALDLPYSHASPRSGTTLRRAATAAAVNRRLHPTTSSGAPIPMRRADGRAEHPHESDADNWVPPPPPYQKDDPGDLPAFMRHNVPAVSPGDLALSPSQRGAVDADSDSVQRRDHSRRSQTTAPALRSAPPRPAEQLMSHQHTASEAPAESRPPSAEADRNTSDTPAAYEEDEEGIYDVSPPESPRPPERPTDAGERTVSDMSVQGARNVSPEEEPPTSLPPQQEEVAHAAPPEEAAASHANFQTPRGPSLDLHIPYTTGVNDVASAPREALDAAPFERRISTSRTWPTQPQPDARPVSAMVTPSYPYSAPVTSLNADQMINQGLLPPAPSTDQLARLSNRGEHPAASHRLSGAFLLSRTTPVGGGGGGGSSSGSYDDHAHRRRSLGSAQLQPPPEPLPPSSSSAYYYAAMHQQRPSTSPGPPPPPAVEDQPLIISTPKGVSGAFDDDRTAAATAHLQLTEPTPILAPVPRHPRASASAGPAVLRPNAERLDTIYSTHRGGGGDELLLPGAAGPSTPSQPSRSGGFLGRRQSRAERSAARNMAEAKRKGWRRGGRSTRRAGAGGSKKGGDGVEDVDAWTDVGASASASSSSAAGYYYQQQRQRQVQGRPWSEDGAGPGQGTKGKGRGGKCAVM